MTKFAVLTSPRNPDTAAQGSPSTLGDGALGRHWPYRPWLAPSIGLLVMESLGPKAKLCVVCVDAKHHSNCCASEM